MIWSTIENTTFLECGDWSPLWISQGFTKKQGLPIACRIEKESGDESPHSK